MEESEFEDEEQMSKEILEHNKNAMSKLKTLKFNGCFEFLKRASNMVEVLELSDPFNKTEKFYSVASITYNNYGCLYQKKNMHEKALDYFQKSLGYNKHIKGDEINLSSTHLNICALFSQQGNHDLARIHGKMALKLLPAAYRKLKQKYTVQGLVDKNEQFEEEK